MFVIFLWALGLYYCHGVGIWKGLDSEHAIGQLETSSSAFSCE